MASLLLLPRYRLLTWPSRINHGHKFLGSRQNAGAGRQLQERDKKKKQYKLINKMSKVTFPFFSISASGQISGYLQYEKHRSGQRVRFWQHPPFVRSAKQAGYRAEWGIAVSRWRTANDEAKAYFKTLGEPLNMAGHNYHLRDYFDLIKNNVCGHAVCGVSRCGE